MTEYLATFAFADRVPGSRSYEVGVDLRKDLEHLALLVTTIPGDQLDGRHGRIAEVRDRALMGFAAAVATWAEAQIAAGRLDRVTTENRRVVVPPTALEDHFDERVRVVLEDGYEIARFEA